MKTVVVLSCAIIAGLQIVSAHGTFENVESMKPDLSILTPKIRDVVNRIADGLRAGVPDTRVVGGKEVIPHSEPHQVALNISLNGRQVFCGGSLISNSWILTAAHCANKVTEIIAVLGAHNIKQNEPSARYVLVETIEVHPDWSPLLIQNDIALLKLKHSVTLDGTYVNAIRLPATSQKDTSFRGSKVTMTGWGKESDKMKWSSCKTVSAIDLKTFSNLHSESTTISPVLRSVDSTVVSNLYCSFRYFFAVIKSTHICASGWKAKGTCNGDSGGPLYVIESDGQKTLIGITSFGISLGCEWSWPPVFTRVTSYLDWIHKTTGIESRS